MLIEFTLDAGSEADYNAADLGYLLHKNPDNIYRRDTAAGTVTLFFTRPDDALNSAPRSDHGSVQATDSDTPYSTQRPPGPATAVLHLDVDPIALVRGKNAYADGLLDQYVNDRPYVANSFLSVALSRALGQSMAGKSKERQDLADRPLPLEVRIAPIAVSGGMAVVENLFQPLGYAIDATPFDDSGPRLLLDLRLKATVRLADLLSHLYVLVPVLDDNKHYFIDRDEVQKLLDKGETWLPSHPAKELITRRALKHRRALVLSALDLLAEELPPDDTAAAENEAESDGDSDTGEAASSRTAQPAGRPREAELEKPIRLHDLRLDRVAELLQQLGAATVLDIGCGEGRLLRRLMKLRGIQRMLGVDPSLRTLEIASRRLHLDTAGEAVRERIGLQMGSLTYGDRRWHGFDVATLVEVIEHIDPPRLSALELSVFGDARPRHVIVTTPNVEYNVLFEKMTPDTLRHADHRFEWTRAEFEAWVNGVAERHNYTARFKPLGPIDETHGAPSQMAIFTLGSAS